MNKPTAQELLQTILGEIVAAHIGADRMDELLVSYAQTYHEEHKTERCNTCMCEACFNARF